MSWLLFSPGKTDQAYTEAVLISLAEFEVVVPHLWHLETA
jgi:hypothetical protein